MNKYLTIIMWAIIIGNSWLAVNIFSNIVIHGEMLCKEPIRFIAYSELAIACFGFGLVIYQASSEYVKLLKEKD